MHAPLDSVITLLLKTVNAFLVVVTFDIIWSCICNDFFEPMITVESSSSDKTNIQFFC